MSDFDNLSGKILIASPYVYIGDVFNKSLIYVLSHTQDGAVGLIVNHVVNRIPFNSLCKNSNNLNIPQNQDMLLVYLGGPVERERGFFLHSSDYDKNILFKFQDGLSVSSNTEIVSDIAQGQGPKDSLFMIGYTGWGAGQLELELENNFWIISDCEKDLIFYTHNDLKWETAIKRIGIEDLYFSSKPGNC